MPSLNSLITKLNADYPTLTFQKSDGFRWSTTDQTVFFDDTMPQADAFCLHELSHAILEHREYDKDIELVKLERDAWEYARRTLSTTYGVPVSEDLIQDNLDTYREWLHARSTCPLCHATGIQAGPRRYDCLACGQSWKVNEARICALRRYKHRKNAS